MRGFAAALAMTAVMAVENHYYPSYGYGTHSHAGYGNVANPWQTGTSTSVNVVDKSKWYSPYQQYSPIRIPFVPAQHAGTKYARCEIPMHNSLGTSVVTSTTTAIVADILFAQRHGKATMSQTGVNLTFTATGITTAAAGLVEFSIREYGRIRGSLPATPATTAALETGATTTNCQYVGPEFNPLEETDKMGRPNPYQDKTRGRLTAYQMSTSSSGATGTSAIINKNVLVNLSGPDSIIGRSIVAFIETGTSPSVLNDGWVESTALTGTEILAEAYGCCVIGVDSPPDLASQTHHHHGPGTVAHSHAGTQYQGHTHSGFSHGGQYIYQSQPASQSGGVYNTGTGTTTMHAHQGYGAPSTSSHGHGYTTGYSGYPTAYGYSTGYGY